ncbi:unnamed protein product, partial [marine sediment metagenome]
MKQTVILAPGESRRVTFGVVPTEARTYQVLVNGLAGSFVAITPIPTPAITEFIVVMANYEVFQEA